MPPRGSGQAAACARASVGVLRGIANRRSPKEKLGCNRATERSARLKRRPLCLVRCRRLTVRAAQGWGLCAIMLSSTERPPGEVQSSASSKADWRLYPWDRHTVAFSFVVREEQRIRGPQSIGRGRTGKRVETHGPSQRGVGEHLDRFLFRWKQKFQCSQAGLWWSDRAHSRGNSSVRRWNLGIHLCSRSK